MLARLYLASILVLSPAVGQLPPDTVDVTLSIPRVVIPAGADSAIIPINLANVWDEVGGVQVDLSLDKHALSLDTVLTTPRSAGWRVETQLIDLSRNQRMLLFDPVGNNILPGEGPIMELVIRLPEGAVLPDSIPLEVGSVAVSDAVGGILWSNNINGALVQEAAVSVTAGRVRIDQGQAGQLGIHLAAASPLMGIHFACQYDSSLISIVDITAGEQLHDVDLEWERNEHGVWIGLSTDSVHGRQLGTHDSLIVSLQVVPGVRSLETGIRIMDAQMIDATGREWRITHADSAIIEVYPGYLNPPMTPVALSGQEGKVTLYWQDSDAVEEGGQSLLLVDDDASELGPPYFDAGGRMADALAGADYRFDYFRVAPGGDGPSPEMLQAVETLIWVTGYDWGYYPTLSSTDQTILTAFLQNGGEVWLIGQDIIHDIGTEFLNRYFGIQMVAEDVGMPEFVRGVGSSIMAGAEYPISIDEPRIDFGDAITARHDAARSMVEGFTHAGAVGQDRTVFWAIEYTFIRGFVDRMDGIKRQLHAFGVQPDDTGGIDAVLLGDSPTQLAPRFPSPVKPDSASPKDGIIDEKLLALSTTATRPSQPTSLPLTGYAVYRTELRDPASENRERIATMESATHTFVDKEVVNGRTYAYELVAIYKDQFESTASRTAAATPISWIDFGIGNTSTKLEQKAQVPVRIKNEAVISGLRFKLRETPIDALANLAAVLGPHSPPDWVVSVERDSIEQEWSVVVFSPQLSVIPPGEGNVLQLALDPMTDIPVQVALETRAVEVLDPNGISYPYRIRPGMVDIEVPPVLLRIGTGAPTAPGDTGLVSIYMDNPHPVRAFSMLLQPEGGLNVLNVAGTERLPHDAHIAWSGVEGNAIRMTELSFTNIPIMAGSGPIAMVSCVVDSGAAEGYLDVALGKEVLLGTAFGELPHASSPGHFPVGEVRAVFATVSEEGAPGRVVTTELQLSNSADVREFELGIRFNPHYLSFLSVEIQERIPFPEGLVIQPADTGLLHLWYSGPDSLPLAPGTGPLANLIFFIAHDTPGDTSYVLDVEQVTAAGTGGRVIFARGESEELIVGVPPPRPRHFTVDAKPTGITHVVQLRSATLGGVYLDAGDELAVVDSGGWINSAGELGPLVVGAGVVQEDGSIQITAALGFDPGSGAGVLPGARSGNSVYYLAWDHNSNTESRPGKDAHYVLGEGQWGENDGFTIVKVVRLGERTATERRPVPAELSVTANDPNPFRTATTIRFGVPVETQIKIAVYDLMGREIVALHDGITPPGYHGVEWDGRDSDGSPVSNGMYFYQLRTPERTITRKMLKMQ